MMRYKLKDIAFITRESLVLIRKVWRVSRSTCMEMQIYFPNVSYLALSYVAFAHTWCVSEFTCIDRVDFGYLSRMFYNHFDWGGICPLLSPAEIESEYLECSFLATRHRAYRFI